MPPRRSKKRAWGPSAVARVSQGQDAVRASASKIGWLKDLKVEHTPGDGFCFFRAVCSELAMDDSEGHLHLAACVLCYIAENPSEFEAFVTEEYMDERIAHLSLQGLNMLEINVNCDPMRAKLLTHIVDQCCGIIEKDWSSTRRYADHLMIQAFTAWSGVPVLIVQASNPGTVSWIGPQCDTQSGCIQVVHYHDGAYQHFNAVVPPQGAHPDTVAHRSVVGCMVSCYSKSPEWQPSRLTLQVVVDEMVGPPGQVDGSDEESFASGLTEPDAAGDAQAGDGLPAGGRPDASSARDECKPNGEPATASAGEGSSGLQAGVAQQERCKDDSSSSAAPRHRPLATSPHPRAVHECRIARLAQQLRSDYRVPLHPSGRRYLQSELVAGVFLPQKHCVWRGCRWTGESDADVIAHIVELHHTPLLQECAEYYHPELVIEHRIFTATNLALKGIADLKAPLACASIDRRALFWPTC